MKVSLIPSIALASLFAVSSALAQGSISGKVTLKGTPPAEKTIDFGTDKFCKGAHPGKGTTRHYVTDASGGLANVLVYVKEGVKAKTPPPTTPAVLNQHGCLYEPYVMAVQVGQPLIIKNSDDTMHNVHAMATKNSEFNKGQPKGKEDTVTFTKPEVPVKFKCDVHPWMFAYVCVVENPFFAVTGADGSFKITGLPPGDYTLAAIHPKAGEQTFKVKVAAGDVKQDISFAPKTS